MKKKITTTLLIINSLIFFGQCPPHCNGNGDKRADMMNATGYGKYGKESTSNSSNNGPSILEGFLNVAGKAYLSYLKVIKEEERNRKERLKLKYDFVDPKLDLSGNQLVRIGTRFGKIDKNEKLVLPVIFDEITSIINNDIFFYKVKRNKKIGLYNRYGKLIIPPVFNSYKLLTNDKKNFYVVRFDKKKGVYNQKGEIVLPVIFDKIEFKNGIFIVDRNEKKTLVNENGNKINSLEYDDIKIYENYYIVNSNNKKGILTKNGLEITPIKYDKIVGKKYSNKTFFVVKINKKNGILNNLGQIVIPLEYDRIEYNNYSFFKLILNDKKGLFIYGKNLVPVIYDKINYIEINSKDYFLFELNRKKGLYLSGYRSELIIPIKYDSILNIGTYFCENCNYDGNELFLVEKNSKKGIIDGIGREVIPVKYNNIKVSKFIEKKGITKKIDFEVTKKNKTKQITKKITKDGIFK